MSDFLYSTRFDAFGVFPSSSVDYAMALRGIAVKDKAGSCALAVFKGETVICEAVLFASVGRLPMTTIRPLS